MLSAAGEVRVSRSYLKCVSCADGGYPADDRLGIDGRYSAGTQRLASLAAASWSYDISSERLEELCGLCMTDNTIREIAQKHGAAMNGWQTSDPRACGEFREADGELELTTDAGFATAPALRALRLARWAVCAAEIRGGGCVGDYETARAA